MEDSRCICNKCENQFKLKDVYDTKTGCILKIPTNNIPLECSHFKAKPKTQSLNTKASQKK